MSLLATAIATHPGATGDVLNVTAGHTSGDPIVFGQLLAHPALPANICAPVSDALERGSHRTQALLLAAANSPLVSDATLERALTGRSVFEIASHLRAHPNANPLVVAHLLNGLDLERFTAHTHDMAVPYRVALTHPTTSTQGHLTALVALLRHHAPSVHPDHYLITEAVRQPTQLPTLAILLPRGAARSLLARYATLAAAGGDPYAEHITSTLNTVRQHGSTEAWIDALNATEDPAVALEALRSTHSHGGVTSAIAGIPRLRHSAAGYFSALPSCARPSLADLDPDRTYTTADINDRLATSNVSISDLNALTSVPPNAPAHLVHQALAALDNARTPKGDGNAHNTYVTYLTRLATHPGVPLGGRQRLAVKLRAAQGSTGHRAITLTTVTALATALDVTAALLDLPVPVALKLTSPAVLRANLAHHLRPALDGHVINSNAIDALLCLAPTFPGTLRELLDTVTSITR